jgi:hypothetical protein
LKAVLDSLPQISSYAIVARRDADGADAVEVRIACGGDQQGTVRVLRESFQGAVKVVPDIALAAPAEIEALQMPEGTRKRRYFVDLRQPTGSTA